MKGLEANPNSGEDWPDPLPKGWVLKKYRNGKHRAHNERTGQTFHTKKDLLRYVHYAETILPLYNERDNKINPEALTRHGPPKAIGHHNEGVSYKISEDEKNMESDDDDDDDDDDDGMYNGIDFSQGIWSVDVEIIERKLDRSIDSGLISTIDVQNTLSESVNDTDTFPALTSHGPPKATDHNEGNSYKIYDDEKNMEKASNDEEGSIDGGCNGGWGMLVELDEGNLESTIENGLSSVTDVQNTSSGSSSYTNKVASKEEDEN